jgi:geranylgeranyl diphosphate synthase type II
MKDIIEIALKNYTETLPKGDLKDAVSYALLAGGKRLRPLLMLHTIESLGLNPTPYLEAAISLELIHTYSLIHDDLPAMDDDTLRRGKPTLHLAFNEGLAILAGDTLLTDAATLITKNNALSDHQKVEMVSVLLQKAGSHGMVLGQVLDIESEGKSITLDELKTMYILKTSRLIEASIVLGAIAANSKHIDSLEKIAHDLGLLFQIQDDYLEATQSVETLGKSKSDDIRLKPTYVTLLGLEETKKEIETLSHTIMNELTKIGLDNSLLHQTISEIIKRNY